MQLHVKYHGFKDLQTPQTTAFTVVANPSDTIFEITKRLEKIAGVSADRVSVMSGLILSNPSGSFKKLDKNGTVSDHGLLHGSTLMIFVPVGQEDASAIMVPPPPTPQITRRSVCVGKANYRSSASEPIKSGDIMAVTGGSVGKSKTTLMFEGVEYANAQDWLAKAFNNSGKSCFVQFEKSQAFDTPRPKRYVPPSQGHPFDRYM